MPLYTSSALLPCVNYEGIIHQLGQQKSLHLTEIILAINTNYWGAVLNGYSFHKPQVASAVTMIMMVVVVLMMMMIVVLMMMMILVLMMMMMVVILMMMMVVVFSRRGH